MNEALIVSNVVLWVLVVVLSGVVLALTRQVGLLHERVAPAGALVTGGGPRPGEVAPVLELEDWSGHPLQLGGRDPEGRATLLFFLSPTCPVCRTLLPLLEPVARAEGRRVRCVLASDGPRTEHAAFVHRHGLETRYVLSTELGLAYQVGRLPHAVLIDAEGVVRARGLVNTREHLESLFEAEARGVASLQELLAGHEDGGRRDAQDRDPRLPVTQRRKSLRRKAANAQPGA
jgi:methylamine dehydrogenase accessory protein MauD